MHNALRALLPWSIAALTILAATSASAQSPSEFYKGKTIDLIVGYAPGAGYDAYAQLLRGAFIKNMPGQPNLLIRHMPGAGSLTAVNHLATARRATARSSACSTGQHQWNRCSATTTRNSIRRA